MKKNLLALLALVLFVNTVYAQPAYLDPSFGTGGFIISSGLQAPNAIFTNIELQPDGKTLMLNIQGFDDRPWRVDLSVHRFMPDGSLDLSFGTNGIVDLVKDAVYTPNPNAAHMRLLPNGKILAAYASFSIPDSIQSTVIQLNPDGSRDLSFANNGELLIREKLGALDLPILHDIQVQHSGNIVMVYNSIEIPHNNYGFRILNSNGQIVIGYENVKWSVTNNRYESFSKTIIQTDDKILVGGQFQSYNGNDADKNIMLEQFNQAGHFDFDFGNNGIAVSNISDKAEYINDLLLEPNGNILASAKDLYSNLFLIKYLPNGAPDLSFNNTGQVLVGDSIIVYSGAFMDWDTEGRIVVTAGKRPNSFSANYEGSITRLNPNGTIDTKLSPTGAIYLPFEVINQQVIFQDMRVLPDRRILACGIAYVNAVEQAMMVRFLPELNATVWYQDSDADGYGTDTDSVYSDQRPNGYVANKEDCNDNNSSINPAAVEVCNNGIDDNCDGITDVDQIAPVVICKSSFVLPLDNAGNATLSPSDLDEGSYDTCSPTLGYSIDQSNFNCSDLGEQTVTLTVGDQSGNSNTCQTQVSVVDKIKPVAICTDSLVMVLDLTGFAFLSNDLINQGSFDNCGVTALLVNPPQLTMANLGFNTVTLTVIDASGNETTCTTSVELTEQTSGVNQLSDALGIKITPNPSSGLFELQLMGGRTCERAEIFNAAGQLVWIQTGIPEEKLNLDLTGQISGCYYLRVQADGVLQTVKLILMR